MGHFALNGGEIFLKPGVYDILRRAVDLGLTMNPVSNGSVFRSEFHSRSLLDTGLQAITFSLDGADPAVHDRLRGVAGLHENVTGVIRRIKREKPRMSVSTICIIMRETAPYLPDYARWAKDLGVDNILFQPVTEPAGRPQKRPDWHKESELFVRDLPMLEDSIGELIRLKTETDRIELTQRASHWFDQ